jgi:hypothetical protein
VKDFLIDKIIKLTKFSMTLGLILSMEDKSQAIRHSKIIRFHVVKCLVIFVPHLSVSKTIVIQLPVCSFSCPLHYLHWICAFSKTIVAQNSVGSFSPPLLTSFPHSEGMRLNKWTLHSLKPVALLKVLELLFNEQNIQGQVKMDMEQECCFSCWFKSRFM